MTASNSTLHAVNSLSNLCRYLGISRETAYQWLACEQLPEAAKIINKRRYWTAEQIENFLKDKTR
jgi:predicted DNA-binding transcriptional regulator AlpA